MRRLRRLSLQKSVRLENGNFRLLSVPVLYLPFATFPAEKQRDSGFLIPEFGESSRKGWILGESVYWAPVGLGGPDDWQRLFQQERLEPESADSNAAMGKREARSRLFRRNGSRPRTTRRDPRFPRAGMKRTCCLRRCCQTIGARLPIWIN